MTKKTNLLTLIVIILSLGINVYAERYVSSGDTRGRVIKKWTNADINSFNINQFRAIVDGWFTVVNIGGASGQLSGPRIPGAHKEDMYMGLEMISWETFYTVDVTLYSSGGWLIEGNRSHDNDRAVAQRQQARQRVRRNPSRESSDRVQRTTKRQENQSTSQNLVRYIKISEESISPCRGFDCRFLWIKNTHRDKKIVVTYKIGDMNLNTVNDGCLYRYTLNPGQSYRAGFVSDHMGLEVKNAVAYNHSEHYGQAYGKLSCD